MNGLTDVIVHNAHIKVIGEGKFLLRRAETTRLLMLILGTARG